jgi:hypothetical protein
MKYALKCVFGLLDLAKNLENGTIYSEKGHNWKKCLYEPH